MTAEEFIGKVNDIYWQNWRWRTLNDDELPNEDTCDKCNGGCVITLDGQQYDCTPNHMDSVCGIRIFNDYNYVAEMHELIEVADYEELLHAETQSSELLKQRDELLEKVKKLEFMIENGLGWDDMRNDITMPHEI